MRAKNMAITDDVKERLAIICDVGYGCRDIGHPCLWFDVYVSESSAALQVFTGEQANRIIEDAGVYDVHELNGMACWVDDEPGVIHFQRMAKIKVKRTSL